MQNKMCRKTFLGYKETTIANAVIEEHCSFANAISRRYCRRIGLDITEDIEAEGIVGLVKAADSYLASKLSFKSWASFKIKCEIREYIKRQFRGQKGDAKKRAIMIPIEDLPIETSVDGLEKGVCNKDQIRKLLKHIPKDWREVITLYYVNGYSLREIGKIKGYTKSNASRIRLAALKRMGKVGKRWGQI